LTITDVEVAFGANLPVSLQVLKTNGVIATYSSDADPTPTIPFGQFLGKDVAVRFVLVYVMGDMAHQAAITDITTALEAGLLHPAAVRRFSLDAIAAAHEAVETGHTAGKVLIDLASVLYLSGMPGPRDWYANLVANPHFTFHLKQSTQADLPARVIPITDETERRRVLARVVQKWNR
jgi:hypothetical protein